MTVAELIAAAKSLVMDAAKIAALEKIVVDAERRFEEDATRKSVSDEDLSRTYSL